MTSLETTIYQALGEASMCWSETPKGTFDSTRANKIGDRICEQIRLQMAVISTASFGYWKEYDSIHPDYDSNTLRDVAKLYQKYDKLFKEVEQKENQNKMF